MDYNNLVFPDLSGSGFLIPPNSHNVFHSLKSSSDQVLTPTSDLHIK